MKLKYLKFWESIAGQLQTDKLAIHSALQVLSLIEEGVLKAQSQLYLLRAELYRKQGLFLAASENYMTFLNCENDRAGTTNVEYVTCAKVNLAIAKYKLGLIHHTVSICNELMTNAQSYVQLSVCLLLACCYIAEDKNWLKALEYVETANCILIGLFPADDTIHSKHGFLKNNMAILNFLNGNKDASLSLITTSIKIVAEIYGQQSFEYVAASMNYIILHFAVYHDGEAVSEKLKDTQKLLRDLDPKANLAIYQDTVGAIEQFITHTEENCKLSDVCGNTNIWKLCNFNLFDYPFGWIDFAPVNHSITLGSDSQVWEHVEKIRHTWPFRYQWLSMTWLGEFHKLKNHHLRLKKRYLDFHIREHVRHYLNDATTNKLDKSSGWMTLMPPMTSSIVT